jgi:hypothetical protein
MRSIGGALVGAILVRGAIATSAEPPKAEPPKAEETASTVHRHLGLFIRLDAGPAFIYASEPYQGSSRSLDGAALDLGFSIGGAVGENNFLAAHLSFVDAFDPGFSNGVDHPLEATPFYLLGFGPEFTHYFMPSNLYLSGAVLLTRASMSNYNGAYGGDVVNTWNTQVGLGLRFAVGKEWWVGDHWSLGVALHYAISWNQDEGAILDSSTMTTNAVTLNFSATTHE